MEKGIMLMQGKGKEKVKIELEIEFDNPVQDIEALLKNVIEGLEHQVNGMGLAPEDDEVTTCSIKASFLEKKETIENYFKALEPSK